MGFTYVVVLTCRGRDEIGGNRGNTIAVGSILVLAILTGAQRGGGSCLFSLICLKGEGGRTVLSRQPPLAAREAEASRNYNLTCVHPPPSLLSPVEF